MMLLITALCGVAGSVLFFIGGKPIEGLLSLVVVWLIILTVGLDKIYFVLKQIQREMERENARKIS